MKLSDNFRACLRFFAFFYANGNLDDEILKGIEYLGKKEGSLMEMAFAIYANNIEMNEEGEVLNDSYSMKRAAQYIRWYCRGKEAYQVEPPFEDWEIKLYV